MWGADEDLGGQTLGESQTQSCCWYILVYLALWRLGQEDC